MSRAKARVKAPEAAAAPLMPSDAESLRLMRERAEQLARRSEESLAADATELYIRFEVGSERFGIPYRFLDEILPGAEPARVPGAPAFIAGVVNRRGDLLSVLDLRHLFRSGAAERRDAGVLVVTAAGITAGIYAPHIEGNDRYAPAALHPPLASPGVRNLAHVAGLHQDGVTMLDITALLSDPALRVDTGAVERE